MENKVKGSLLIDYIRMIRANASMPWDRYLTKEDFDLLEGRVLPSNWYALETFQRMGMAVFHLLAKGDLKLVWLWGRVSMEQLLKIYKLVLVPGDPLSSIKKFSVLRGQLYTFESISLQEISDRHVLVMLDLERNWDGIEPYAHQVAGGMERLVELCEGKKSNVQIIKKSWAGDPTTVIDITWE